MANPASSRHSAPARPRTRWLPSPPSRATLARLGRYLGALALLGVGIDHIEQYYADSYSALPTIGTLFALNFVSATVVTLGLLAPIRRIAGRWAGALLRLLGVGGIGIAAGSLAGLLVSENGGLFGFMEQGYRGAIVISIALEVATMILLGLFLVTNGLDARRRRVSRHAPHSNPRNKRLTPDRPHADQ
jgi:hypothetical protein